MSEKTTVQMWVEVDVKNFTPVISLSMDIHAAAMVASGFKILSEEMAGTDSDDAAKMFAQLDDAISMRFGQIVQAAKAMPSDDATD